MKLKLQLQICLNTLCPSLYNNIIFLIKNRYICHINNPTTFNEKVQWRKKYQHDERFPALVDKWEVRNYIEALVPGIVVPTYGVYSSFEEIQFNNLPNKFIIKPTHGFGRVIICSDKKKLKLDDVHKTIDEWLSYNQYDITGEWQYKDIKPRIIIDALIGENIRDYKFFCFNGEPFAIQIDSNRYTNHTRQIRDINWNRITCSLAYPNDVEEINKPDALDEMLKVCRILSKKFDFVRVDLFFENNKIYFSELTFTPGNGMDRFSPKSIDFEFGERWNLPS